MGLKQSGLQLSSLTTSCTYEATATALTHKLQHHCSSAPSCGCCCSSSPLGDSGMGGSTPSSSGTYSTATSHLQAVEKAHRVCAESSTPALSISESVTAKAKKWTKCSRRGRCRHAVAYKTPHTYTATHQEPLTKRFPGNNQLLLWKTTQHAAPMEHHKPHSQRAILTSACARL